MIKNVMLNALIVLALVAPSGVSHYLSHRPNSSPVPSKCNEGKVETITVVTFDSRDAEKDAASILRTTGKERKDLLTQLEEGAFSTFIGGNPPELQFSDAMGLDPYEEAWGDLVQKGDLEVQVFAARVLWQKHSRRYSRDTLKVLTGEAAKTREGENLRQIIENSFKAENIRRELQNGDYKWGTWLASLRPHASLVPMLLENLKKNQEPLPETIFALGQSRDKRAYEPLTHLLNADDYVTKGFAAAALGHFGNPDAEPLLIQALSSSHYWVRVKACRALSMIGTRRAVPALERLAKDDRFTGVSNVQGMAQYALDSIKEREKP
jgi:hypothetical protein